MAISPDQAKVYELLVNVISKFILVIASSVVYVIVTLKLIFDPSWPVATVEMVLSGTTFLVFKHYFPTSK